MLSPCNFTCQCVQTGQCSVNARFTELRQHLCVALAIDPPSIYFRHVQLKAVIRTFKTELGSNCLSVAERESSSKTNMELADTLLQGWYALLRFTGRPIFSYCWTVSFDVQCAFTRILTLVIREFHYVPVAAKQAGHLKSVLLNATSSVIEANKVAVRYA